MDVHAKADGHVVSLGGWVPVEMAEAPEWAAVKPPRWWMNRMREIDAEYSRRGRGEPSISSPVEALKKDVVRAYPPLRVVS